MLLYQPPATFMTGWVEQAAAPAISTPAHSVHFQPAGSMAMARDGAIPALVLFAVPASLTGIFRLSRTYRLEKDTTSSSERSFTMPLTIPSLQIPRLRWGILPTRSDELLPQASIRASSSSVSSIFSRETEAPTALAISKVARAAVYCLPSPIMNQIRNLAILCTSTDLLTIFRRRS